jgi:hypothetical protein
MCGGEASIRIERADNGFLIDAYSPGNDGPGEHKRIVASSPEEAMKLARPLLAKVGKKKGRKGRAVEVESFPKKRTARKRA